MSKDCGVSCVGCEVQMERLRDEIRKKKNRNEQTKSTDMPSREPGHVPTQKMEVQMHLDIDTVVRKCDIMMQ